MTGRILEVVGARGFEPPTPWSRIRFQTLLKLVEYCCFEMIAVESFAARSRMLLKLVVAWCNCIYKIIYTHLAFFLHRSRLTSQQEAMRVARAVPVLPRGCRAIAASICDRSVNKEPALPQQRVRSTRSQTRRADHKACGGLPVDSAFLRPMFYERRRDALLIPPQD
jgi:hypothetical protein